MGSFWILVFCKCSLKCQVMWKPISLFHWGSKQCFISFLLVLMRKCCLLLIELSKQSMYILFDYFSSFSSYGNYLWADNDCYHLFVPPNYLLIILHRQLIACVIANWLLASTPLGIGVLLPKAKYLYLFLDWMIYFVTKHTLFNKFMVSPCNMLSRPTVWSFIMVIENYILNIICLMKK